jgi:ornithine cyclodeaminase/alanine dehydrogenase-like protein (mu-crystallin family)
VPVIVLTNEQVRELMPIGAYVDAIETAYCEYGLGRAVNQTRIDLYGESPGENQYCVFKSMVGMLPKDHVVALRINSDVRRRYRPRKAGAGSGWSSCLIP